MARQCGRAVGAGASAPPTREQGCLRFGKIASFAYDALNRRTTLTDQLGNVTTTLYDAVGNPTETIDPEGHRTTLAFDALGRHTKTIDALGGVATMQFDQVGNMTVLIDPVNNRTTYSFDALNRVGGTMDELGNVTQSAFDHRGRRIVDFDALGQASHAIYDAVDNLVLTIDRLGRASESLYDANNRPVVHIDDLGNRTTTGYDAVGNATTVTDPLNHVSTFGYDGLNSQTTATDALAGVTTTLFDAVGNQTGLIDPVGNRITWSYDALNRLTQRTDPANQSGTYAYDAMSRMTSLTDRLGRRRDFSYDELHRKTQEVWIESGSPVNTLSYDYDEAGNLLVVSDENGTYTMGYDAMNRVTSVSEPFGLALTFSYDKVGNRTLVQDSLGGVSTSTYNAENLLTRRVFGGSGQTPLRLDLGYTAADELSTLTRYNDLAGTSLIGSSTYMYDDLGRLYRLQHRNAGGTLLANYTYGYDAASRLATEQLNGATATYGYDLTNQLATEETSGYANDIDYDANGNRTTFVHDPNPGNPVTTSYDTDTGNRLTNDGVYTYTLDAEGNITKKSKGANDETWFFGYDHRNQMLWAEKREEDDLGSTLLMRADYKYDVFGNRIEKAVDADGAGGGGTTTTRFAQDGWQTGRPPPIGNENWDVWAELDGSNDLQMRYLRTDVIDHLFARIDDNDEAAWYLTDRLGSIRDILDDTGAVQDHIDYSATGEVTTETSPGSGDRHGWTGRPFWGEDPLEIRAKDTNYYRYTGNSFLNAADPSGLAGLENDRFREWYFKPIIDKQSWTEAEKVKALAAILTLAKATEFKWDKNVGVFGKCHKWVEEYDRKTSNTPHLRALRVAMSDGGYFHIDGQAWENSRLQWNPLTRGAGHCAVRVTFDDGTTVYFDDGYMNHLSSHIFSESQVPSHYVPLIGEPAWKPKF